jgi:hypothetical protein
MVCAIDVEFGEDGPSFVVKHKVNDLGAGGDAASEYDLVVLVSTVGCLGLVEGSGLACGVFIAFEWAVLEPEADGLFGAFGLVGIESGEKEGGKRGGGGAARVAFATERKASRQREMRRFVMASRWFLRGKLPI